MHRTRIAIVFAALALGLIGLAVARATTALQAQPNAVAVVRLDKVFDNLKQMQKFKAEETSRREQLQAELKSRQEKLQTQQADLDMLTPGTPGFIQAQEELTRAAIELQVWSQFEQQKLARDAGLQFESLYRDTLGAIGRVAEANGFDLVLYAETEPEFRYENLQQLLTQMSVRKVLYAKEALDVTDQVVQQMNNEFDAGN